MSMILHFIVLLILLLSVLVLRQQGKDYSNPVLAGFYPDPSTCRISAGYYLVNSTFSYYPGIPVFYGKDLIHWKHISNLINRPEQMNSDSLGVLRGTWKMIKYTNNN